MQALLPGNLAEMLLSHSSSHCWEHTERLLASSCPPSSLHMQHLERDGMQQSSHSDKPPSHGDSGEFFHWFQQDQNSTQEKAILNYCPDSASQDRKAEKQLSCRFPSASCCGATVSSCRGMKQPWRRGYRSSHILGLSCCCFNFCPVKSRPRL